MADARDLDRPPLPAAVRGPAFFVRAPVSGIFGPKTFSAAYGNDDPSSCGNGLRKRHGCAGARAQRSMGDFFRDLLEFLQTQPPANHENELVKIRQKAMGVLPMKSYFYKLLFKYVSFYAPPDASG